MNYWILLLELKDLQQHFYPPKRLMQDIIPALRDDATKTSQPSRPRQWIHVYKQCYVMCPVQMPRVTLQHLKSRILHHLHSPLKKSQARPIPAPAGAGGAAGGAACGATHGAACGAARAGAGATGAAGAAKAAGQTSSDCWKLGDVTRIFSENVETLCRFLHFLHFFTFQTWCS